MTKLNKHSVQALSALAIISLFFSCLQSRSDGGEQTGYLDKDFDLYSPEKHKHYYTEHSDYFDQVGLIALPPEFSIERKLLLTAFGLDPNVRAALANRIVEQHTSLEIFQYLNSDEASLALAAAWTLEKAGDDDPGVYTMEDIISVYKRADVIEFGLDYQR